MRAGIARALLAGVLAAPAALLAQKSPPPGARYEGHAYDFRKIADGVWFAVATGVVSAESNNVIIETPTDVIVVDATTSPAAAWALQLELRRVTTKPVRDVVVTHFHYDHSYGIQAFPPGADVISTEFTREMIASGKSFETSTAQGNRRFAAAQIETATTGLDTATTDASKTALRKTRSVWQAYLASLATLKTVPPNVTVSQRMSIVRGDREVQIIFPGKAHTDGDLVVWLPKERILATGDLFQPSLPFMGDGYLDKWAAVLDSLRALRPSVILPGHGDEIRDVAVLERLSDYMRAVWSQCSVARTKGLTPEQAAAALDLSRFDAYYPRPAAWTDSMVVRRRLGTVQRVYQLLDAKP